MDFFLALPSNVKALDGSENYVNRYKTEFIDPILLDGEWTVGLSEISFLNSMDTIHTREEGRFTLIERDDTLNIGMIPNSEEWVLVIGETGKSDEPAENYTMVNVPTVHEDYVYHLFLNRKLTYIRYNLDIYQMRYQPLRERRWYAVRKSTWDKSIDTKKKKSKDKSKNNIEIDYFTLYDRKEYDKIYNLKIMTHDFFIPIGRYTDIQQLVDIFNNEVKKLKFKVEMRYMSYFPWIELNMFPPVGYSGSEMKSLSIEFSPVLKSIFGYPNRPWDLTRGIYHAYVYVDIINPVRVGTQLSQVIKIIPLERSVRHGDMVIKTYESPVMIKVIKNQIQKINVELRTDSGELLPLNEGKTVVVLKFKKQK